MAEDSLRKASDNEVSLTLTNFRRAIAFLCLNAVSLTAFQSMQTSNKDNNPMLISKDDWLDHAPAMSRHFHGLVVLAGMIHGPKDDYEELYGILSAEKDGIPLEQWCDLVQQTEVEARTGLGAWLKKDDKADMEQSFQVSYSRAGSYSFSASHSRDEVEEVQQQEQQLPSTPIQTTDWQDQFLPAVQSPNWASPMQEYRPTVEDDDDVPDLADEEPVLGTAYMGEQANQNLSFDTKIPIPIIHSNMHATSSPTRLTHSSSIIDEVTENSAGDPIYYLSPVTTTTQVMIGEKKMASPSHRTTDSNTEEDFYDAVDDEKVSRGLVAEKCDGDEPTEYTDGEEEDESEESFCDENELFGSVLSNDCQQFLDIFLPHASPYAAEQAADRSYISSISSTQRWIQHELRRHFVDNKQEGQRLYQLFFPIYARSYQTVQQKADKLGLAREFFGRLCVYAVALDAFRLLDVDPQNMRLTLNEFYEGCGNPLIQLGEYGFFELADCCGSKVVAGNSDSISRIDEQKLVFLRMDENRDGVVQLTEWCTFLWDTEVAARTKIGRYMTANVQNDPSCTTRSCRDF